MFAYKQGAREAGVKEMKMCPNGAGFVVLARNNIFYSVASLENFKPRALKRKLPGE
jgi:hypothetical protein